MNAGEIYDVYGVFALMPEVVEAPFFRRLHYLVLLSAFIGVPSALAGASTSLHLAEP